MKADLREVDKTSASDLAEKDVRKKIYLHKEANINFDNDFFSAIRKSSYNLNG